LLQIYFRLWECKIYQNRLRYARVIDKSLQPHFLCATVYMKYIKIEIKSITKLQF